MKASIQARIAPPDNMGTSQAFKKVEPEDSQQAQKSDFNFDRLMNQSQFELKQERAAKERGDYSNAKTEEEFFNQLSQEGKPQRIPKNTLEKDDFLKLFVAQLQHQDPLNPDDGAEMATKLAQFNSLEQMMNVNKTLTKMMESQNQNQNFQLVNYIGKEVIIEGGHLDFRHKKKISAEFDVKHNVAETIIQIRDKEGALVKEEELGTKPAGSHTFRWDGTNNNGQPVTPGFYSYQIIARDINGETIPVEITSKAKITGVDVKSPDGTFFSSLGKINLKDIVSVGKPGYQASHRQKNHPSQPDTTIVNKQLPNAPPDQGRQRKTQIGLPETKYRDPTGPPKAVKDQQTILPNTQHQPAPVKAVSNL